MTRHPVLILVIALVFAIALTGCAPAGDGLESYSDASGLFHVRVPGWQATVQPGLMVFTSSKNLPDDPDAALDSLSVSIFTAQSTATESVGPRLTRLLESRAKDRAWKSKRLSTPVPVIIGKRPGVACDVTGTDDSGTEFQGRAALVRSDGSEVLVFAVAPPRLWKKHSAAVEDLFTEWYWHVRSEASSSVAP